MTLTASPAPAEQLPPPATGPVGRWPGLPAWQRTVVVVVGALAVMSLVRVISGANGLTSQGTIGAALRLAVPIGMAGLGGIFAERVGIVNIGLEGMMVLGTWFGAYGAYEFGPWWGLLLGVAGGALGGLLHAIATVTFNVDHIISGVAINIVGPGLARFLSVIAYDAESGGSATQSPRRSGEIADITVPGISSGLKSLEDRHWFFVSDVAGVVRGLTTSVSLATIAAAVILVAASFLLWRTRFGLRLRAIGENPYSAESLGVPVLRIKYGGVVLSGMCAGFGGAFLSIVLASIYREGQTGGKGFIGLATMIFGNWRPGGLAAGALLFGYSDGLQLRASSAVPALFLLAAILCALVAAVDVARKRFVAASIVSAAGAMFLIGYLTVDELADSLSYLTPYVVTLVVLATSSQRLRPPAAEGQPYRRGEAH
ncbi:MAG: ABC transporter permease [Microthrixaceae bacterium]|nr:ABC transporter permease [Microthrixaceae bacterium]